MQPTTPLEPLNTVNPEELEMAGMNREEINLMAGMTPMQGGVEINLIAGTTPMQAPMQGGDLLIVIAAAAIAAFNEATYGTGGPHITNIRRIVSVENGWLREGRRDLFDSRRL